MHNAKRRIVALGCYACAKVCVDFHFDGREQRFYNQRVANNADIRARTDEVYVGVVL